MHVLYIERLWVREVQSVDWAEQLMEQLGNAPSNVTLSYIYAILNTY